MWGNIKKFLIEFKGYGKLILACLVILLTFVLYYLFKIKKIDIIKLSKNLLGDSRNSTKYPAKTLMEKDSSEVPEKEYSYKKKSDKVLSNIESLINELESN